MDGEPKSDVDNTLKTTEETPKAPKEESNDVYLDGSVSEVSDDMGKKTKEHVSKFYPMRETSVRVPFSEEKMIFNGLVCFTSLTFLWGIAIFCMVDPSGAKKELDTWFQTTIKYFTWLYIGGHPVRFFFIIWVAYKYGHIKLGHRDAKPEFSDVEYFSMLFSAGVGVGLFFFGVSEPLIHQTSNYYADAGK